MTTPEQYEQIIKTDLTAINAKDKNGNTPLHILLTSGSEIETIKEKLDLLIEYNVDLNIINNKGKTPLNSLYDLYNYLNNCITNTIGTERMNGKLLEESQRYVNGLYSIIQYLEKKGAK